jgi:D-glycero-D-manno-heptose 1,7-bisphosphate phosphatase
MKLVILDRDGTINEDRDDYVKSADEWVAIPGALEAIARLNHAGWHTVIATNQAGLARGLFDMATLNAIHARMNRELATFGGRIDAVFFCPHKPEDGCTCRKPLPGLLRTIGERYGVDLRETYMIGDSLRDLRAGVAVGCAPHLVRTGKGARLDAKALRALAAEIPHAVVHADLAAFAQQLVQRERHQRGDAAEPDSVFVALER